MSGLALIGYGRMGKLLEQLAPEHGFEVLLRLDDTNNLGGIGITEEAVHGVDVAVEFSLAEAVADNAERLAALGVPHVVGTTGWLEDLPRVIAAVEQHAAQGAGFLHGANFSIGVQVFYRLAESAARLLSGETSYEAWLWEIHHSKKKDAPSGTLKEIRRVMEGAGWTRGIDVANNRAGAIPGTHQVGFDSEAGTIVLEHRARSRAGFAHGALRAARWMIGRRGVHEFSAVWEEIVRS